MLRAAFKLPLRQAEGLLSSFIDLLGCDLAVPDHTTVSRRAIKLPSIARAALPEGPLYVVIDSTGLKVYGAGEWLAAKHGQRARRGWRKLHLAVDTSSGQIVGVGLTDQDVDDASRVEPLRAQIQGEIEQFTADGAYTPARSRRASASTCRWSSARSPTVRTTPTTTARCSVTSTLRARRPESRPRAASATRHCSGA
jgi:Transposase DDE domain